MTQRLLEYFSDYNVCYRCGARYPEPKVLNEDGGLPCASGGCTKVVYMNAVTVPVVLQPIYDDRELHRKVGLLIIRRGKQGDPGYLKWAYPGGFQGIEDWRVAATREEFEEVGIRHEQESIKDLGMMMTTPDGTKNLMFCMAPALSCADAMKTFKAAADDAANIEVAGARVIYEMEELAFPMHTQVCERFFTEIAPKLRYEIFGL